MIHSCLVYCINVYGSANKTNMAPLIIKQKKAIRIITNAGYRDHTAPLFARLGILPIEQQIHYSKIKFMHSFTFNKLPSSFFGMWTTKRDNEHGRMLRNMDDLVVPPHRIELVKKLPLVSFPTAWNSEGIEKFNHVQHIYLKILKKSLLASLPPV